MQEFSQNATNLLNGSGESDPVKRSQQLQLLLDQAGEIIDGIEVTLREQRDQARAAALEAADATTPESQRLIDLMREMHLQPANASTPYDRRAN